MVERAGSWYLSINEVVFGPLSANEVLKKHELGRDQAFKISLSSQGPWIDLESVLYLLETFIKSSASKNKQLLLSNIISTYIVNKQPLKLGRLRNPVHVAFSEAPYSLLCFGGDWFAHSEREINQHIDDARSWRQYSQFFRTARIPLFHIRQAMRLARLLNVAERNAGYEPTKPIVALLLAIFPVLFIFYFQSRLNRLWSYYIKHKTRKSPRFDVNLDAQVMRHPRKQQSAVRIDGKCSRLSFGGAQVDTTGSIHKVRPGDELLLSLPKMDTGPSNASGNLFSGAVAWVSGNSIGVRFGALNQRQMEYLQGCMRQASSF